MEREVRGEERGEGIQSNIIILREKVRFPLRYAVVELHGPRTSTTYLRGLRGCLSESGDNKTHHDPRASSPREL